MSNLIKLDKSAIVKHNPYYNLSNKYQEGLFHPLREPM